MYAPSLEEANRILQEPGKSRFEPRSNYQIPSNINQNCCVLVKILADGFVEVYGPKGARALVINIPKIGWDENALKLEEWVDAILPKPFLDVHWPAMLVATTHCESLSLSEVQGRVAYQELFENLRFSAGPERHTSNQVKVINALGGGR